MTTNLTSIVREFMPEIAQSGKVRYITLRLVKWR